ncbi:hypothetical protein ES708_33075 [subsurface metagenome]
MILALEAGEADITVSYTEEGITETDIVEVTVSAVEPDPEPDPNQAPVITSAAVTSGTVGELYTYTVEAEDLNEDTLTYSLTENPLGMTIVAVATTGVISWTPTGAGRFDVGVKVADPDGLFDVQDFKITVTAPTLIDIADITGVTAPVTGATPVTAIDETVQYTGAVTWEPAVVGTFAAVTVYTATITLTPKAGYTLTGVEADFFTVDGEAVDVANVANSGEVSVIFPATDPVVITESAITGVDAPVAGTPPTSPDETSIISDQYTGTIIWTPLTPPAGAGETYTAEITLVAKPGYTLDGVEADFFTVDGAEEVTVPNVADEGVVTVEFLSVLE